MSTDDKVMHAINKHDVFPISTHDIAKFLGMGNVNRDGVYIPNGSIYKAVDSLEWRGLITVNRRIRRYEITPNHLH